MTTEAELGWNLNQRVGIPVAHPKNSGIMAKHIGQYLNQRMKPKSAPKAKGKAHGGPKRHEAVSSNKVKAGGVSLRLGKFY
jgi:hypothetical protein